MSNYKPGTCNINVQERQYRRNVGLGGVTAAFLLLSLLVALGVADYYRIILLLPMFIGILGLLQARNSFCVKYGMSGLQNADDDSTRATKVIDVTAKNSDRKRSQQLYVQAILLSLFFVVLAVLIP